MLGIDPYTAQARLCDDDGVVRQGAMHHGRDYPCTGHAHFAGDHYRCTSPAHATHRVVVLPAPGRCPTCGHQPGSLAERVQPQPAVRLGDGLGVLPPWGYRIVGVGA